MENKNFRKIPKEELNSIIESFVEIELIQPFNIIKETLTRIGVLKKDTLYQTAHILHKKGKYYIVHFKQLFALDGKNSTYDESDEDRIYKIVNLLKNWGMIKIIKVDDDMKCIEKERVFVQIVKKPDVMSKKIKLEKKYDL